MLPLSSAACFAQPQPLARSTLSPPPPVFPSSISVSPASNMSSAAEALSPAPKEEKTVQLDREVYERLVDSARDLVLLDKSLQQGTLEEETRNCPPVWRPHIESVVFSEEVIQEKVKDMALQISKDYEGKEVVCVGLLTGAVCFMTDLIKYLQIPYKIDFMTLSSYGKGTKSTGSVNLKKDMSMDPAGKHILVIEDIIDTGGTLAWLKEYLSNKKCASVRVACLLDKKARRLETNRSVKLDYMGFHCPDQFVIGYGMDFAGHYRCLPFIGVLKPEVYMDQ